MTPQPGEPHLEVVSLDRVPSPQPFYALPYLTDNQDAQVQTSAATEESQRIMPA